MDGGQNFTGYGGPGPLTRSGLTNRLRHDDAAWAKAASPQDSGIQTRFPTLIFPTSCVNQRGETSGRVQRRDKWKR